VEQPLSFADKNYASVRDLHRLTIALVMPQAPDAVALGLSPAHREFLLAAMSEDPLESHNPVYVDDAHAGLRYKTMLSGIGRVLPIERIRYVNKPGRAYGFHLDAAYVEDTRSRRAMFVTVVIYANANEILNDDEYEYDEVTRPFLDDLGEVLARAWLLG
ncbi:MAG: hypothetical protein HC927_04665, partial [Deltaproteobacteria bacterium]|nr:hypothetical protein [Deltaproteobacteria bacterium]